MIYLDHHETETRVLDQLQCGQVRGARKRHRDAGPSTTLSSPPKVTTPKSITLPAELLETDSAFTSASVAHKISASMLPPADKERMNGPSHVNASSSKHYAWLALAPAMKDEQTKQIERENKEYRDRALTVFRDIEVAEAEKKEAKAEAEKLQGEQKRVNKKLKRVNKKLKRVNKKLDTAMAANKYGVQRAFALWIDVEKHIHSGLDLSTISIDKLRSARYASDDSDDGNGEGDNIGNAEFIVATEVGNNDHDQDG